MGALAPGWTRRRTANRRHQGQLPRDEAQWNLDITNRLSGEDQSVSANFVYVGAGGTAIHLLQTSGIKEIKGVGGFPV